MQLFQCNDYLSNTVDADVQVFKHQGNSSYSVECTTIRFQLYMG